MPISASIPDHVIQRCDSCQMVMAKYTLPSEIRGPRSKSKIQIQNPNPKLGRQIDTGAHLYRAYDSKCLSGENFWRLMALLKTSSPAELISRWKRVWQDGGHSDSHSGRTIQFSPLQSPRICFSAIAKHFLDIFDFRFSAGSCQMRIARSAQPRLACVVALGRFRFGSDESA